jgi:hypothetical protein
VPRWNILARGNRDRCVANLLWRMETFESCLSDISFCVENVLEFRKGGTLLVEVATIKKLRKKKRIFPDLVSECARCPSRVTTAVSRSL